MVLAIPEAYTYLSHIFGIIPRFRGKVKRGREISVRRLISAVLCLVLLAIPVRGSEKTKYVALTFDDGPSGRFTQRLLEGLAQRDVKATFLLCGYRMREYPETAEAIFCGGHEIGIHGYSHKDMSKMNYTEALREIRETAALLPKGCQPAFVRPPGGAVGPGLQRAAREMDLYILNWSVDPEDWKIHDASAVEAAVVDVVQDGDVILLHDMYDGSVDAALAIIDKLQAQGFRFVTVSQLAFFRGTVPKPGQVYRRF